MGRGRQRRRRGGVWGVLLSLRLSMGGGRVRGGGTRGCCAAPARSAAGPCSWLGVCGVCQLVSVRGVRWWWWWWASCGGDCGGCGAAAAWKIRWIGRLRPGGQASRYVGPRRARCCLAAGVSPRCGRVDPALNNLTSPLKVNKSKARCQCALDCSVGKCMAPSLSLVCHRPPALTRPPIAFEAGHQTASPSGNATPQRREDSPLMYSSGSGLVSRQTRQAGEAKRRGETGEAQKPGWFGSLAGCVRPSRQHA